MSGRRCWVEVDGRALARNLKVLRGLIPRTTRLLAVVKANAYGHGLVTTSQELEARGVDWLGVANVAEGLLLRQAGVRLPILLLSATLPDELADAVRNGLTVTLSSLGEAKALDRVARRLGKKAEAHFKIDTGMGRLGRWHGEAHDDLARIRLLPNVILSGLCTHFASADDDARLTRAQWKAITPFFEQNRDLLCHAANSPAVTRRYGFHADMVRTGLALYGIAPNPADQRLGFRPALTWKSRICLLREVKAGRTVSYGATYRVPARQTHAVVAIGYGDGYLRAIRGRVTMDQIVIDVTRVPAARVGNEVVALGRQGKGEITARELAHHAGTIPWEILTNIGSRVPRFYHHFTAAT
jgi:alanine racemase